MVIVDLSFCYEASITDPAFLFNKYAGSSGHFDYLAQKADLHIIKHLKTETSLVKNKLFYAFFRGSYSRLWLPLKAISYIKKIKADIIIIHGFVFPVQILCLLLLKKKNQKIIIQHHGEFPYRHPIKNWIQKTILSKADAYLFTSKVLANPFLRGGIIKTSDKIYEAVEVSTAYHKQDKLQSRQQLGIGAETLFLWVGRLNPNKDPLTVLRAMNLFWQYNQQFRLLMFYGEGNMEAQLKTYITENGLSNCVELKGQVRNRELEKWYSAADYFISASHYEAGGTALTEAMACGCVPIVTNIPAFVKVTDNGVCSYLFDKGDSDSLFKILMSLQEKDQKELSEKAKTQFQKEYSFEAASRKLELICQKLHAE
jgi:glycosyltransferase involved in cell wall biosynthesis